MTGPGFVACLVDEEGYTEDYSPAYYYGCWSGPLGLSYEYYTWRLDPDLVKVHGKRPLLSGYFHAVREGARVGALVVSTRPPGRRGRASSAPFPPVERRGARAPRMRRAPNIY